MKSKRVRMGWLIALACVGVLIAAGLVSAAGCGTKGEVSQSTASTVYRGTEEGYVTTTAAGYFPSEGVPATQDKGYAPAPSQGSDTATGGLSTLEAAAGQKVITDAVLEIEVEQGKFQAVFEQARLLADRYDGYVVSSQAFSGDEEDAMKSGTVVVRVPASSFNRALSDAEKLGHLKREQIQTQDVTEEFVDLKARIANAEAHVKALQALLAKAQTVDEILQVQQTLTYAQEELERLQGRMRYLDEHTSYSTLTMTIYEVGAEVVTGSNWGVIQALKDALKNVVKAFNAIVRGLGVLIPVLILLAIIAYIIYRVVLAIARRNRQRRMVQASQYPMGWGPPPAGWVGTPGPGVAGPTSQAGGPESSGPAGAAQVPGGSEPRS